jgi:hypothetical protein
MKYLLSLLGVFAGGLLVIRAREARAWQEGALAGWEAARMQQRLHDFVDCQSDESAGDYGLPIAPDRLMDWIH